jgi:Raf kinase inhibitor-like YbhB/YbcL family protein
MHAGGWVVLSTSILLIAVAVAAQGGGGQRGAAPAGPAMTLTVAGFQDGGQIPVKFSQAAQGAAPGEGTSPAISWTNAPAGTQSFVLNMHDLDVARNKTSDDQAHWVVWNIPASATGLPEGVPKGSQRPDGSFQVSATGPMYRGPGAAATGPMHHYMFRDLCPGREGRGSTGCGRIRDARERLQGDAGTHPRQSRVRRIVQASAIAVSLIVRRAERCRHQVGGVRRPAGRV